MIDDIHKLIIDGYTQAEIAELLGVSYSTVVVELTRHRKAKRKARAQNKKQPRIEPEVKTYRLTKAEIEKRYGKPGEHVTRAPFIMRGK